MSFSMEVVDPKALQQELVQEIAPEPEEKNLLRDQAQKNAAAIMSLDLDSMAEKTKFVSSVEGFGLESMQKSSTKNNMLKVTVNKLSQSGAEGGQVSKSLTELQKELRDLDPSGLDFGKKGVFGKVFNPVKNYFEKYEKSENVIANIIDALDKGKATLKNDNTTLALEEQNLREMTKKLQKEIEMGTMMDECISQKVEEAQIAQADPDKIKFVQEEILFPLRQRVMDMQQMTVVNQQGIVAMEIIQRNNKELIRGVERAKLVTVSALRTAVMVASALYNQKIVLKKIEVLNATTSDLIANTSRMLKEQGAEIHKQSMESTISPDVLKQSFSDLMEALDSISQFKQNALPVMKQTIEQFGEMAAQGEAQIQKLERGSALTTQ